MQQIWFRLKQVPGIFNHMSTQRFASWLIPFVELKASSCCPWAFCKICFSWKKHDTRHNETTIFLHWPYVTVFSIRSLGVKQCNESVVHCRLTTITLMSPVTNSHLSSDGRSLPSDIFHLSDIYKAVFKQVVVTFNTNRHSPSKNTHPFLHHELKGLHV